MDKEELDVWFAPERQGQLVARLVQRIGMTRSRAECFVRLWVYLVVKQQRAECPRLRPPLAELGVPLGAVVCTHREAAELFYSDKEQGSDRAAGLMLDKLAALGLITKGFDGNTTTIVVHPLPGVVEVEAPVQLPELRPDEFLPRCDAVPVANLLATNYNWMNHSSSAVPHRIARLLRGWAEQYGKGMRVLRRCDTEHPVGFCLLYPTACESEANFFQPPHRALHLSTMSDVDPFVMATPQDPTCVSLFVRSWMIELQYRRAYRSMFLQDAQQTMRRMREDFPNLCDVYTLVIHPMYEQLGLALGFQRMSAEGQPSIYWIYQSMDRFLALDMDRCVVELP